MLINALSSIIRLNEIFSLYPQGINEIYSIVAAEISRLFSADCTVYHIKGDMLEPVAFQSSGSSDSKLHLHAKVSVSECRAITEKKPLIFDSFHPCASRQPGEGRRLNSICIPVSSDEVVAGVLIADFFDRETISNDDFNLLMAMVSQLSNALHRNSLFDNLKAEKERLEAANQVINGLNRELNDKISEMETLQAQLLESQKLEAMGRLAGGIAHDFNNILVAIMGYSELASSMLPEGTPVKEYIRNVIKASEKAKALTNQVLAFSRKQIIDLRAVSINDLIMNFKVMLDKLIPENIEVRLSLSHDVSAVMADAHQLEQIIMNLAVNAKDAIINGGVLSLTTENASLDSETAKRLDLKSGRYVLLSISDSGSGMPEDIKQHIFEPFYTTKEGGRGTGLGLAVVYGIVKQHNGAIEVYSSPGIGTTFRIYLPPVVAIESSLPVSEKPDPQPELPVGTERILVVEDSEPVLELVCSVLSTLGYRVDRASDGSQALAIVRDSCDFYDLIITDIIMPAMNGEELAVQVRKICPGISIVFMSGYPQDKLQKSGMSDKRISYLSKPFKHRELALTVRAVLDA
jgi:signal transduction histidine kinase